MSIFNVLSMIGGLALFLYGMHLMGEGLSKASGGKLESILEKLTSNPVKAVLLGAGIDKADNHNRRCRRRLNDRRNTCTKQHCLHRI